MNTDKMMDTRISAFADGSLDAAQQEQLLLALQQPEARQTWEAYHCIGDVLRSPETAIEFSPGFSAKMIALLAAEPAHLCAAAVAEPSLESGADGPWQAAAMLRRFGLRGAAVAAAVVLTFVAIPKLSVLHHDSRSLAAISAPAYAGVSSSTHAAGEVLRHPQIDEYMLAHQRYSPSVYNTAQFARSATFVINK